MITKEIKLTRGFVCIVSVEDYDRLSKYKWYYVSVGNGIGYARTKIDGKYVYMHRFIMNAHGKIEVDHIDLNRLNNTRTNLRLATTSQNQQNTSKRVGTSSIYKGVTFNKDRNKWKAAIKIPNTSKVKNLGDFIQEIDAAIAYDNKAKELFGEYARLNFPEGVE